MGVWFTPFLGVWFTPYFAGPIQNSKENIFCGRLIRPLIMKFRNFLILILWTFNSSVDNEILIFLYFMFDGESKNKTKEKLINNLFRFKFKKESEIRILTRSQKSKRTYHGQIWTSNASWFPFKLRFNALLMVFLRVNEHFCCYKLITKMHLSEKFAPFSSLNHVHINGKEVRTRGFEPGSRVGKAHVLPQYPPKGR